MRFFLSSILLLTTVGLASAQERTIARAGLPRAVEARLTAIVEDPATRQITGEASIGETYEGNVVVFTGPLTLTGRINGELIVIDGNVDFREGSAVTGDVTLVGGDATGVEYADIGGTVTMYGEGFGLFRGSERVFTVNKHNRRIYREDYRRAWGHSSFTVRTGWNYNRVEGLPVHFGPTIETGGRNPTRFEAHAIWRTEVSAPWDTDELGYSVRAEQFFGGRRDLRIGASLRSVVDPIETWQLNKVESSLATFVLHEDYRDYYKREGWSGYLQWAPRASGLSATVEYRDEDHSSEAARDPWTIFDNGDSWRAQPLVAEGKLRSVRGTIEFDRRDDEDFPSSGFLVRGELTHAVGGDLAVPAFVGLNGPVAALPFDEEFTAGLIDARIYRLVGRDATLSFRFVGAGSLTEKSLPPQFQHAFGGAGSLPGYSSFSADCGARTSAVLTSEEATQVFFPYYGCDRMALFSAEYRGGFDFHWGGFDMWDEDDDHWDWDFNASPNWIVFFDAARGWANDDARLRGASDTETLYDVGAGILLGDVGIYTAVPLTGEDRSLRFFVRLGPRF
jgi:hypothetical protein